MKTTKVFKYLIGIDEVGRGPLAGPVAVCSFVFLNENGYRYFKFVKDSKQLTEAQREDWFTKINQARIKGLVKFEVCFKSEKLIDEKGITFCIKKALVNSLAKLNIHPDNCRILLDGGLKAPKEYIDQVTLIRGDARRKVIALASICAKVTRDRYMKRMALKYPGYGFEVHKGYATKKHYAAIKSKGILPLHRSTFLI